MKIALGVLFLLLLVGTFVFLWNKTRPEKEVFAIVKPHIDTLEKRAVATGKVEPRDEVLIKPQISGIISEIYKEAGELVQQGEVIAKVKVIPEMATLNSAESRVNVAKISLEQTRRDYDRVKELFDSGSYLERGIRAERDLPFASRRRDAKRKRQSGDRPKRYRQPKCRNE